MKHKLPDVEWTRQEKIHLQTLRAKIGYFYYLAQTIYKVL